MNGTGSGGLPWVSILGFIRIATHPNALDNPLDMGGACTRIRSWLVRPQTILVHPGVRHADILFNLLEVVGGGGNLTTDAHLAALAIDQRQMEFPQRQLEIPTRGIKKRAVAVL